MVQQDNPWSALRRGLIAFLKISFKVALAMILVFGTLIAIPAVLNYRAEHEAKEFCASMAKGSDIAAAVQRFEKERGKQGVFHIEGRDGHSHLFIFPGMMFDTANCDVELDDNGRVLSRHSSFQAD